MSTVGIILLAVICIIVAALLMSYVDYCQSQTLRKANERWRRTIEPKDRCYFIDGLGQKVPARIIGVDFNTWKALISYESNVKTTDHAHETIHANKSIDDLFIV